MYEILRFAQNDKDLVCQREGGGGWWLSHQPPPPSKTQVAVILSETKCSEESHANFKNYPFSSDLQNKIAENLRIYSIRIKSS